jgi:quercetin dioxygenase-like cupin family protein
MDAAIMAPLRKGALMSIVIKNIETEPWIPRIPGPDGKFAVPGIGRLRADLSQAQTKFLGADDENGPWVYLIERPAGDVIPRHKHSANRIEFIMEGELHWRDAEGRDQVYGKGTINYVTAGTEYEYVTTQPTRILLWFDRKPSWVGEANK